MFLLTKGTVSVDELSAFVIAVSNVCKYIIFTAIKSVVLIIANGVFHCFTSLLLFRIITDKSIIKLYKSIYKFEPFPVGGFAFGEIIL